MECLCGAFGRHVVLDRVHRRKRYLVMCKEEEEEEEECLFPAVCRGRNCVGLARLDFLIFWEPFGG